MVVRDPEDEAEDKEQEIAKDQEEAEKINTELDRIKQLANYHNKTSILPIIVVDN